MSDGQIEPDAVLVLIPNQFGSLSVCSAVDLASALMAADDDASLEDVVGDVSIDMTMSIGWKADQAERISAAVARNNSGGDYWKDED